MYSIYKGGPTEVDIDDVRRQEGKCAKTGYAMIILDGLMAKWVIGPYHMLGDGGQTGVIQNPSLISQYISFEDGLKLLKMRPLTDPPQAGKWVQLLRGTYNGDVGYVLSTTSSKVVLLLIPRLAPPESIASQKKVPPLSVKRARARKKRRTGMTETTVRPLKSKSLVSLLTDAIYQRTSFTPTIQLGHISRKTQIEKGVGRLIWSRLSMLLLIPHLITNPFCL